MSDVGIGPAWQTGVAIEEGTPHLNFFLPKQIMQNNSVGMRWDGRMSACQAESLGYLIHSKLVVDFLYYH